MTQTEWALDRLMSTGMVTRNEALENRITRLGAIIHIIKRMGFSIDGRYEGRDYVYRITTQQ